MKAADLRFPEGGESLPPPRAGTLDEYLEFLVLLAENRSENATVPDIDKHDGPRFRLP